MSFDSAYAWWQARGGETTDIAPPMLISCGASAMRCRRDRGRLRAASRAVLERTRPACGRIARRNDAHAALMLIVGFAPVPWLLRGHVWTDVGIVLRAAVRVGVLADAHATQSAGLDCRRVAGVVLCGAVRHNALPAVLPLAVWMAGSRWAQRFALRRTYRLARARSSCAPRSSPARRWSTRKCSGAFRCGRRPPSGTSPRFRSPAATCCCPIS